MARARPLQADAVAALASARNVLDATWHTALESASAEPGDALTHWKVRWDEHCTQSGLAVQGFDAAVAQYNAAIAQFPARLLAWVFGFKAARTLQPVQESSSP